MSADLPCSFCGYATPHSTLAAFGARCKPCFDAYCLEQPKPPANPQGRQRAFMHRRPASVVVDDVPLAPAVPNHPAPARFAAPEDAQQPAATTTEPPELATEDTGEPA